MLTIILMTTPLPRRLQSQVKKDSKLFLFSKSFLDTITCLCLGVACLKRYSTCLRLPLQSKSLYFSALLVLIVCRKKTLANKASPSPDFDSLEKTEPIDSSSLLNSATKNKGKKITTIAIEISSDEEEIATPKAKGTSANRKTVSKKRTPANKPSPSPEIDYLEKKIEASDEEEIATPTPKAKGTSANRKIVSKKRTPANKPSPSPEIDYLEKKIKAEPLDSGILLDSTPKNKGKKKMTAVLSDEEEIATPISKAKNTLANRKTASPSKTKLCVLIRSLLSLHCFIFFSPVSGSDREDQRELAGREKSPSNKSYVVSFAYLDCHRPDLPIVPKVMELSRIIRLHTP